ncbi:unnamed protein product [Moneuplotes crassus]|uniref:Uncharacterized protein n=1 Tax=Euplotes crassus TaxID=5936 RepID=A0AAD1XBN6_EUPCR|nr:unnamed protein product [Moneuplotes crassus]
MTRSLSKKATSVPKNTVTNNNPIDADDFDNLALDVGFEKGELEGLLNDDTPPTLGNNDTKNQMIGRRGTSIARSNSKISNKSKSGLSIFQRSSFNPNGISMNKGIPSFLTMNYLNDNQRMQSRISNKGIFKRESGLKQDSIFGNKSKSIKMNSTIQKSKPQLPIGLSFGDDVTKFKSNKFNDLQDKPNAGPLPDFTKTTFKGNNMFGIFPRVNSGMSGFDTPRMMTRGLSSSLQFNQVNDPIAPQIKEDTLILNINSKKKSSRKERTTPKSKPKIKKEENKETRWKKEDDRKLFPAFLKLIGEANITQEQFLAKETRMSAQKKEILEKLKDNFNWSGTIYALRDRIKKRLKTSSFTAREKRVLHRKLRELYDGKITIEQVTSHFPGKTVEQVEKYKKEFYEQVGLT